MEAVPGTTIPLGAESGDEANLVISCRGDALWWRPGIAFLLDTENEPEGSGARFQLLEEAEYIYQLTGLPDGDVHLEPQEIFDPDHHDGRSGRLRPGRHVGGINIDVHVPDARYRGSASLEVRSRKLDYLNDFRWMLNRIATEVADLLLQRFAPSAVTMRPEGEGRPASEYARFALLQSLLDSEELESAIQIVLHRPHSEYEMIAESVHPSRGLRGGRYLARALTRPGPRQPVYGYKPLGLETLPERVDQSRHVETLDTIPNRFVKYALGRWRSVAATVASRLDGLDDAAAQRGRAEADELIGRLDRLLGTALFQGIGDLDQFPASNQVLQKREGYRDILRAFFEIEAAAAIEWGEADDVFPAGSKDVATLYEYWVYLELARLIEEIPSFEMDRSTLVEPSKTGLTLNLCQGKSSVVRGRGRVNGRDIHVELFYNRTFGRTRGETGAWTRQVRPDVSLWIKSSDSLEAHDDVWLHFDAKYRVQDIYEAFGDDEGEDDAAPTKSRALTDDLLKMHTYRDAIKRTAGSYVLYPGQAPDAAKSRFQRYHEILPGIGAFALRPTPSGETSPETETALQQFVTDVIDYVTTRGTGLERSDYWTQRTYRESASTVAPTSALDTPPADTLVLIGFVKSPEQWEWIERTGLYNLRADDRPGSVDLSSTLFDAQFVLFHGREGFAPRLYRLGEELYVRSAEELESDGYPDPGGRRYVCVRVLDEIRQDPSRALSNEWIVDVKSRLPGGELAGAPVVTTWDQVFEERATT